MRFYTKYRRKLRKFTEFCDAQWFYLKRGFKKLKFPALAVTSYGLKIGIASLVLASIMILGERAWIKRIEDKTIANTFFIKALADAERQGSATGFAVKAPSGKVYTLTNAHVCALANKAGYLAVQENKSKRFVSKRVIEVFEDNDLCLVEGFEGYEGLQLANEVSAGDHTIVIGYPLHEGLNISSGRVKNFNPIQIPTDLTPAECKGPRLHPEKMIIWFFEVFLCMKDYEAVGTNASTYPGNSGSPMINLHGKVIGVIFAANTRTNWGYAVPLKHVRQLLSAY